MKFNKIAACLVATACTASLVGAMASVSAADSLTIKAGSTSAKAGETFTIDIELTGVPSSGVAGLDFAVKYDASIMEVTGVTEGQISKTSDKQVEGFSSNLATNIASGAVSVLWATGQIKTSDSWIKSDGVLLTLNCKALKDGTSDIEIVKNTRKDATSVDAVVEGLKIVNPTTVKGSVKVGAEETTTTTPAESKPPVSAVVKGDADLSGAVDMTDLSVVALHILKESTLTGQAFDNADVDGSGTVALDDLTRIKQFVSKKIDKI